MSIEAMKMALEALEFNGNIWHIDCKKDEVIAALRQAIESAEHIHAVNISKECVDETAKDGHEPVYMDMSRMPTGIPDLKPGMVLPLPKREWVWLTDEEIETIVNNNTHDDSGYDIWCHGKGVARDIQAKLKEKNG